VGTNGLLNMAAPKSLYKYLAPILPGIFLIGYNIGTGSITSMSKAGANYGTSLLWTVVISCLITYYLMIMFGRYTMVSGETAMAAIRLHIHPGIGIFFIAVIGVIIVGAVMGVMGIIADVLHEWSKQWSADGIPSLVWAGVLSLTIYLFFWWGTTDLVKKVLSGIVLIMSAAFIINMIFVLPSLKEILAGFIPSLPTDVKGSDNSAFLITASMVGTTVSSIVFLMRTSLIKDANWTARDMKMQKKDARLSAAGMFILSAAVLIAAAATLHTRGLTMNHAAELIPLLEPIVGETSMHLMTLGIVAAGLSSHIPNLLVLPWLVCDYRAVKLRLNAKSNRVSLLFLTSLGITVPLAGTKPVFIMLLSQGLLAILLPATVAVSLFLLNSKKIMRNQSLSFLENAILIAILIFALFMGSIGFIGFLKDFMNFV